VESSCELGNEPSGFIKCWKTIEWLHNLWPLEWYSAPQLVSVHWMGLSVVLFGEKWLEIQYIENMGKHILGSAHFSRKCCCFRDN
jgi:hypothetical protein